MYVLKRFDDDDPDGVDLYGPFASGEDAEAFVDERTRLGDPDHMWSVHVVHPTIKLRFDGYGGLARYRKGDLLFYGYLNEATEFVELFAESIYGRSFVKSGTVHPGVLEQLEFGEIEWFQ